MNRLHIVLSGGNVDYHAVVPLVSKSGSPFGERNMETAVEKWIGHTFERFGLMVTSVTKHHENSDGWTSFKVTIGTGREVWVMAKPTDEYVIATP